MKTGRKDFRPEQQFLVSLCHQIAGEEPTSPDGISKIRENELYSLCHGHQVLSLIHSYRKNIRNHFPLLSDAFYSRVASYSAYNVVRVMAYQNFLKEISGFLENQKIPYLVIKGLIHGIRFYPSVSDRSFTDIDIIVHPEALPVVHDYLLNRGFAFSENLSNRFPMNIVQKYGFARHYITTRNPQIIVDLHVSITNKLAPFQFNTRDFILNSKDIFIGNFGVKSPAENHMFILLLHHVFKHYYFRLIWLIDLFLFLDKTSWDGEESIKLIREHNLQILWNHTFPLFREIFGRLPRLSAKIGIIRGYNKQVFSYIDVLKGRLPYTPSVGRLVVPFKVLPSWRTKMRFFRNQIFPPPRTIEEFYQESAPKLNLRNYLVQRIKTCVTRIGEYLRLRGTTYVKNQDNR